MLVKIAFYLYLFYAVFFQYVHLLEIRQFQNAKLSIQNDEVVLITGEDYMSFFALGDSGGIPIWPYKTLIGSRVADKMAELSKKYNNMFQILLGDNFYTHGVKSSHDKRFQRSFERIFSSNVLVNSPWFITLGNHDYKGNTEAQIEYSKLSKRWIMPALNYNVKIFTHNGEKHLATLLMVDTMLMCGVEGISEPNKNYFSDFEKRLKETAETNVPYIIVAGHFPVWSIADHGPTRCLVDNLRPLLYEYKVSAYFSGHDHNLQHIQENINGQTMDYIVSGAASLIDGSRSHVNTIPPDSLKFDWHDSYRILFGGFVLVQADETIMKVKFFRSTGDLLYETSINPRF